MDEQIEMEYEQMKLELLRLSDVKYCETLQWIHEVGHEHRMGLNLVLDMHLLESAIQSASE